MTFCRLSLAGPQLDTPVCVILENISTFAEIPNCDAYQQWQSAFGSYVFHFCLPCVPPAVSNRKNNSWIILIHPDVSDWVRCDDSPGGCLQAFIQTDTGAANCSVKADIWFICTMWLLTNSDYSCILWLLLAFSFWVFLCSYLTLTCIFEHYQYMAVFFNCGFSFLCLYPSKVEQILILGLSVLLRPRFQNQLQALQGQECSWCWYFAVISPFFYPKGGNPLPEGVCTPHLRICGFFSQTHI